MKLLKDKSLLKRPGISYPDILILMDAEVLLPFTFSFFPVLFNFILKFENPANNTLILLCKYLLLEKYLKS